MDKRFEDFIYQASKSYFGVTRFTKAYLVEHEKDIRDAMYIALQAIKFGCVEVACETYEDGSFSRVFTVHDCLPPLNLKAVEKKQSGFDPTEPDRAAHRIILPNEESKKLMDKWQKEVEQEDE